MIISKKKSIQALESFIDSVLSPWDDCLNAVDYEDMEVGETHLYTTVTIPAPFGSSVQMRVELKTQAVQVQVCVDGDWDTVAPYDYSACQFWVAVFAGKDIPPAEKPLPHIQVIDTDAPEIQKLHGAIKGAHTLQVFIEDDLVSTTICDDAHHLLPILEVFRFVQNSQFRLKHGEETAITGDYLTVRPYVIQSITNSVTYHDILEIEKMIYFVNNRLKQALPQTTLRFETMLKSLRLFIETDEIIVFDTKFQFSENYKLMKLLNGAMDCADVVVYFRDLR